MKTLGALAVLTFFSTAAPAAVLFSNPMPGTAGSGSCSPCVAGDTPDYRVWDQFILASNAVVQGVDFLIDDITPGGAASINVSVWDVPMGQQLFSHTYSRSEWSALQPYGAPGNTLISVAIPELALAAGSYYLSILGQNGTQLGWRASEAELDRSLQQYALPSATLVNGGYYDAAFAVTGVVPEPESWALFASGLTGLAVLRRRRKTAPASALAPSNEH